MKIKKKVKVIKEIDVEIKTPYFCKSENGFNFYKVLNEKGHNIRVITYGFATSIEFSGILNEGLIFAGGTIIEIKENEFNEAFEQALETLKNK